MLGDDVLRPGGHEHGPRAGFCASRCRVGILGKAHECAGEYKEVVPNRKLSFTWSWPNSTPERVSVVTIIFKAVDGGTQLLFRHEQLFDEKVRDDHKRGWTGTLDKLAGYLQ